jgi:hypothetical protein
MVLEAYFTLSHKAIVLKETVSKSQRKKIWGGILNDDPMAHFVLIGHLGKFIGSKYKSPITAAEIIDFALEMIEDAQKRITFGSILVECKDELKLIEKYAENGFTYLQDDDLVQLMRRV